MKTKEKKFKAVEFMRNVRNKMTKKYLSDKEKYFAELDEISNRFLNKRKRKLLAA